MEQTLERPLLALGDGPVVAWSALPGCFANAAIAKLLGSMNDGFRALDRTHTTGQQPTFIVLPDRSFKGLFDSETCRTIYESKSAKADIRVTGRLGPHWVGLLPFESQSSRTGAFQSSELKHPTQSESRLLGEGEFRNAGITGAEPVLSTEHPRRLLRACNMRVASLMTNSLIMVASP